MSATSDILKSVRGLRPGAHFQVRAVEWLLALIMLLWGVVLLGPEAVTAGKAQFLPLLRVASQHTWGCVCVSGGTLRMAALLVNGSWRRTPTIRTLVAIGSGLFWLQISYGLLHSPNLTLGVAVCPPLFLADLYAVWVAAFDAGRVSRPSTAVLTPA